MKVTEYNAEDYSSASESEVEQDRKFREEYTKELLKNEVETIEVLPDNAKLSETILVGNEAFNAHLQLALDEKEQEEFEKYLEYVKQHN